jgi:hypothetical protein
MLRSFIPVPNPVFILIIHSKINTMKKVIFFAITAIAFTYFTAFKAAPPAIVTDTPVEQCGPYIDNNPCTGEIVTTTGCIIGNIHTVINGNRASVTIHAEGNMNGVGSSGSEYNVHANSEQHENISLVNGQGTGSAIVSIDFISKGSSANLHLRRVLHITVNANGDVTVTTGSAELTCNG